MPNAAAFAAEDLTDAQVRDLVARALDKNLSGSCYVQDVNRAKGTVTYQHWADGSWSGSGALYRATFSVSDDYAVTLGEGQPVIAITEYEEVAGFSLAAAADGSPRARFEATPAGRYEADGFAVYPNSLLFRAGDYPDKQFAISPEELRRAADGWQPVAGNIAHTDFLKGRAAFIDRAWTEEGDRTLRGQVRVPLALDRMLTDGEKCISMEWNRAGKFADGFALVTNPRISDAALMSLDITTPKDPPAMSKFDEFKQGLKDLIARFSEKPEEGAEADAAAAAAAAAAGASGAAAPDAEKLALQTRVIEMEAAAFADAEIAASRALPAERADLIADFARAAHDDAALPATVNFSVGGEQKSGSRVEALKARHARRPAHHLTEEVLGGAAPEDAQALFARGGSGKDNKPKVLKAADVYRRRAEEARKAVVG